MRKRWMLGSVLVLLLAVQSSAQRDFIDREGAGGDLFFRTRLSGLSETPSTLATPADGEFLVRVRNNEISYRLTYFGLVSPVLFAHIHFGAAGTTGGVAAFLCGGAPPNSNKAACPNGSAVVTGTIVASDIIGPGGQGVGPGDFSVIVNAMRNSAIYANVHTERFPGGEIRGQVQRDDEK